MNDRVMLPDPPTLRPVIVTQRRAPGAEPVVVVGYTTALGYTALARAHQAQGDTDGWHPLPYWTRKALSQYRFKVEVATKNKVEDQGQVYVAGKDWKVIEQGEGILLRVAGRLFDVPVLALSKRLYPGRGFTIRPTNHREVEL